MKMSNEVMDFLVSYMDNLEEKGKLGYVISYNRQQISEKVKTYLEMRDDLIRKYGTKDEKGNMYIPNDKESEQYQSFMNDLGEIPKVQVDVDILTVTPEEFYSGTLTSKQMSNLMWMVEQPKKETENDKDTKGEPV